MAQRAMVRLFLVRPWIRKTCRQCRLGFYYLHSTKSRQYRFSEQLRFWKCELPKRVRFERTYTIRRDCPLLFINQSTLLVDCDHTSFLHNLRYVRLETVGCFSLRYNAVDFHSSDSWRIIN